VPEPYRCPSELRLPPLRASSTRVFDTLSCVLQIEGNPQRLINAETVSKGGAAVKAWLVRRLPGGYTKPAHALEAAAEQEDPPPPPPPQPPSRPKADIAAEVALLEETLASLKVSIDGGGGSLSTTALAAKKKEAAKCKSAIARLKAEL